MRQFPLTLLLIAWMAAACTSTPVKKEPAPEQKPKVVSIGAAGDIFMGGKATKILNRKGYHYPYTPTKSLITGTDIFIANLEAPLTNTGTPAKNKRFVFKSPPEKVTPALKEAGVDIVTLANNHSVDYGMVGLQNTISALDQYGIAHVGAGETLSKAREAVILTKNGLKIGFLGYSLTYPEEYWADSEHGGTAFAHEKHLREDIRALKSRADIIIVSFHWGRELSLDLRPYQTRIGHLAIDEGAALVLGHHPHIMQGIELYKKGLIIHSLGNFVFGSYSKSVHYGGLAHVEMDSLGVKSMRMHILDVNNFRTDLQPRKMQGKSLSEALTEIKQRSALLNTSLEIEKDTLYFSR